MKKLLLLFFYFALTIHLFSSNLKFYSIDEMYGISMRETNSICKDANGFIWTSSKTGVLCIADGVFRFYELPYETTNTVFVRLVYDKSAFLAYTGNGQLFKYDEFFDQFYLVQNMRSFHGVYLDINRIAFDIDGKAYLATNRGIFQYQDSLRLLKKDLVFDDIVYYNNNMMFYATNQIIGLFNTQTLESVSLCSIKSDSQVEVSKLFYDHKTKLLWIGTFANGLFCYSLNGNKLIEPFAGKFPKQPILAMEENNDSSLLVGIDGQGVWQIDRYGKKILNIYKENVDDPVSLRGDGVYDIYKDKENKRIWIATYSGGLSFFDQESLLVTQIQHRINNPNSLKNDYVNKILQDSDGNIWFATNNGISRWNIANNEWLNLYQNKNNQAQVFLALCEDNGGNIWAGTYSSGIYVIDKKTGRELKHYSEGVGQGQSSGKFIFDLYKDSDGDIWIANMQNDVICYLSKEKQFRSITSQVVRSFAEFSKGKILLACTFGLIMIDKATGKEELLSEGYYVQDILVLGDDIWMGTSGNGLIHYNYKTKASIRYTTQQGLVSNFVNSVTYANGYLWLGTENGLCRFNPVDKNVLTYSSYFALSNSAFNVNSRCRLNNGDIILGSNNGGVMFDPNMLFYSPLKGRIFLQEINISGRSVRENPKMIHDVPVDKLKNISLKYNQNTLLFELLPVGVTNSGSKFSWKLEGFDDDWTIPVSHSNINYTNIPSGDYNLKIRMYDSSLSQLIDERALEIHITPPFWNTIWFKILVGLILIGIAYFVLKIYVDNIEQRHAEDKIRFFTNMAHDIRTSLTLIEAPIEELNKEKNLSEKGSYYLNLSMEQAARLSFVATQLLDFQKVDIGKGQLFLVNVDIVRLVLARKSMFEASARKKGVELIFVSNQETYFTAVDELKIEKVIDNLISNAVKYSNTNSRVEIKLNCDIKEWQLEVKDYGLGISEKAQSKLFREFYRGDNVVNSRMVGSGIGLMLVKNYVTMHGGVVRLKSKENEGSVFLISIPYKVVYNSESSETPYKEEPIPFNHNETNTEISLDVLSKNVKYDSGACILIVEDNIDLQNFLKVTLQDYYKVLTANDGVEAWEIAKQSMPDMVISDIMMPNMDGFELCKNIKSSFETSHISVILLTALSERNNQLDGLGLGADDYITKPFDMSMLLLRVKSIVLNRNIVRDRALRQIKYPDETEDSILNNNLNDAFVKNALKAIYENISDSGFGKEQFASAMNVSSSLLYKKIKSLTGLSPIDLIKVVRLDHSQELLKSKQYSVTEISELCGFSSVGYFSTVFKKHFGKSPTEIIT